MVEVKNLSKYYAKNLAVKNLNFSVDEGEILGFLGPNGAGKSTTMNIMTGYLSSTSGTVTIDGYEILKNPIEAKAKIGYLPEMPPLYFDMTVKEYLNFVFDLKNVDVSREEHISKICQTVKIDNVYDRLIKNLSKGYKQRVGLAQALMGDPKLLILDEPTVGLDPQQIIEIRNLIKNLGKKHTIILSSHVLTEVQAVCDRVIVINKGVLVANDTTENLTKNSVAKQQFIVTVDGDKEKIYNVLNSIDGISNISEKSCNEDGSYDFIIESDKDIRRTIAKVLSSNGFIMLGLKVSDMSLEDIFCELMEKTSDENQEAENKSYENSIYDAIEKSQMDNNDNESEGSK